MKLTAIHTHTQMEKRDMNIFEAKELLITCKARYSNRVILTCAHNQIKTTQVLTTWVENVFVL